MLEKLSQLGFISGHLSFHLIDNLIGLEQGGKLSVFILSLEPRVDLFHLGHDLFSEGSFDIFELEVLNLDGSRLLTLFQLICKVGVEGCLYVWVHKVNAGLVPCLGLHFGSKSKRSPLRMISYFARTLGHLRRWSSILDSGKNTFGS